MSTKLQGQKKYLVKKLSNSLLHTLFQMISLLQSTSIHLRGQKKIKSQLQYSLIIVLYQRISVFRIQLYINTILETKTQTHHLSKELKLYLITITSSTTSITRMKKRETVDSLIIGKNKQISIHSFSNKWGQLAQGNDTETKETDTIDFIY